MSINDIFYFIFSKATLYFIILPLSNSQLVFYSFLNYDIGEILTNVYIIHKVIYVKHLKSYNIYFSLYNNYFVTQTMRNI